MGDGGRDLAGYANPGDRYLPQSTSGADGITSGVKTSTLGGAGDSGATVIVHK
jgi:hypothetical protein